jgi:CubicO group peptidase (beta-lactamase class C family)
MKNITSVSPAKALSEKEMKVYSARLQEYFDSVLKKGFNGQILVAKNGQIVFEKYSGYADLKKKDTLTENTPLHIASTSKTFTAMAILHLAEEGKLKLTDTLGYYFPRIPYYGINIKMLLSHRSGLPNYLYFMPVSKDKNTCYTNADVLNSLYILQPRVQFLPGSRFSYSNTNFVLLALIIEKITGESFPVYLKKLFFDPLHMIHTHVHVANDSTTATSSFQWNGNYWKPDQFDCTYGDKNVYTTARDLLKWDQAFYYHQLFKKETLDSAFAPHSNERPSVHNYGWGWRMLNLPNGKKVLYHNGRWHGTNAVFARLPDENATIIIIGNKFDRRIYTAGYRCFDIFGNYFSQYNKTAVEEDTLDAPASGHEKFISTKPVYKKKTKTKR